MRTSLWSSLVLWASVCPVNLHEWMEDCWEGPGQRL